MYKAQVNGVDTMVSEMEKKVALHPLDPQMMVFFRNFFSPLSVRFIGNRRYEHEALCIICKIDGRAVLQTSVRYVFLEVNTTCFLRGNPET